MHSQIFDGIYVWLSEARARVCSSAWVYKCIACGGVGIHELMGLWARECLRVSCVSVLYGDIGHTSSISNNRPPYFIVLRVRELPVWWCVWIVYDWPG